MAHMLSMTASVVTRPTATLRTASACPVRLNMRRANGHVLSPASTNPKRMQMAQVVKASSASRDVDRAGRDAEREAKGFLADKGQQKAAYTFLAIAWGAVAVFKLFATHQFTDFAFDIASPGAGLQGLTRLAGFSSLAPAAAAYTLAKAAKGERLDSHTYLRQNLGLAFAGTLTLYYMWRAPAGVLTNAFHKLAIALSTFTAILGGAVYAQTSGHGFNLAKIAEGFGSSISALLSTENLNATMYSLLSAGLGLYAAVLLFGPHELASQWLTIGAGEVSLHLQREIGLSAALGAIQTYCLKDAADRYKLGRSTFKNLNLALATIAAGNFTALWWAINTANLVTWSTQSYVRAAFLGAQFVTFAYNWIESDRDESEDVGRIEEAFDDATDGIRGTLAKGERKAKELWHKGEEKAEEAKHKGEKWTDKAKDRANRFGDKVEDTAEDAKHKGQKWTDQAKSKANRFGDEVEDTAEDAKHKGEKWTDKASQKADQWGNKAERETKGAARDVENFGDKAQNKAEKWTDKAADEAGDWGDKAERETKGAGRDIENFGDKAQNKAQKWTDKAGDEAGDWGDKAERETKGAGRDAERFGDKAQGKADKWSDKASDKADKWTDKAADKADQWGDKAEHETKEAGRDAERLGDKAEKKTKEFLD